jgi:predicted phosphodiesterase
MNMFRCARRRQAIGCILGWELVLLLVGLVLIFVGVRCYTEGVTISEAVRSVLPGGKITNGPVLLRVYEDRAAIMWETDSTGLWWICYGACGKDQRYIRSTGQELLYKTKDEQDQNIEKTTFIHKVWLDDLQPGRNYYYRIFGLWDQSKANRFRTVPADADEVTFIVYGDSRTYAERHRRLIRLMMKENVDFIVHSGDLVSNGDIYEQWGPQFFEPLKGLVESVPLYIAKGNHEGNNGIYEKLLTPEGEQNCFGFDYGPVHYFCADNVSRPLEAKKQLKLIVADAKASGAEWKFVSYHVPSLNFGGHFSSWAQPDALPDLAEAGVDFVIVGHSHQYERFRPVEPPDEKDGSYVTYITSGGGRAPLYDVLPSIYHAVAKKVHHYCRFHIKGGELTMDAIDIDGRIIDHVELSKSGEELNKQYLWTAVPIDGVRLHQALLPELIEPLSAKPQQGRAFNISYRFSVGALTDPANITFTLRGDEQAYSLPATKSVTLSEEEGSVKVDLTVTPLVEVKLSEREQGKGYPIVPALWLDCNYEIGRVKEDISLPIVAKAEKK